MLGDGGGLTPKSSRVGQITRGQCNAGQAVEADAPSVARVGVGRSQGEHVLPQPECIKEVPPSRIELLRGERNIAEPFVGDGQVALVVDVAGVGLGQPPVNGEGLLEPGAGAGRIPGRLRETPQPVIGDGQVALVVDVAGVGLGQPPADGESLLEPGAAASARLPNRS